MDELYSFMVENDLAMSKVARKAGITPEFMCRVYKGKSSMKLVDVEAWAETLGFEVVLRRKEK